MNDIPYGYCQCGCGRKTRLAIKTMKSREWIKGQPLRFINGHNGRGQTRPKEVKEKISRTKMGYVRTPESRMKQSMATKGRKLFLAPEMGKYLSWRFSGSNNPNWRGGSSRLPYAPEFNEELRTKIRNRDKRICRHCGKTEEENGVALSVHHIDYDRMNSEPFNLISLCVSCHCSSHHNRKAWIEIFTGKMIDIYNPPNENVACCV